MSTTDPAGCLDPGSGSLVIRFEWIDRVPGANGTKHVASYSYLASEHQLFRTVCEGDPLVVSKATMLADNVVTTASPSSPAAWCDGNEPPAGPCPASFPKTVSVRITENDPLGNGGAPDTFTLTASLRPQSDAQPDTSSPTPLLLLGRDSCGGSDDTTGLGVALAGNVHVYGQTLINATDVSGHNGCSAMSLNAGTFRGGRASILSGGTCQGSSGSSCPAPALLGSYATAFSDPYAGLTPPTSATDQNGCPGGDAHPGVYTSTLSVGIFGSCSLDPGVYILRQGISVGLFGSLTSKPGGVLLYITGGAFEASFSREIDLAGMSSGPYSGLVVWQDRSDTNTVSFTGSLGGVSLDGILYAPQAQVNNRLSLPLNVNGIVAQTLVSQIAQMNIGAIPTSFPSITGPPTLPSWTVNRVYPGATMTATDGYAPYIWTETGLPPGLSLDPDTGVISGTPTVANNYTVQVTVTDQFGDSDTKTYLLTIAPNPSITTSSLPDWTVSFDYHHFPMHASGGTTPFTWSAVGLPTGLSIIANTGVIVGSPTAVGSYTPTISLVDTTGATASRSYTVHVNSLPSITGPDTVPSPWTADSSYDTTTITTANGTAPFTWAASGLPPGMSVNNNGDLGGTPTTPGTYAATITATDAAGAAATISYSIVINAPLSLGSSLPNGEIDRPYNHTVVPIGGTPPYSFSIRGGSLPDGLTMTSSGVISGTPTTVEARSVTIRVRDHAHVVVHQDVHALDRRGAADHHRVAPELDGEP